MAPDVHDYTQKTGKNLISCTAHTALLRAIVITHRKLEKARRGDPDCSAFIAAKGYMKAHTPILDRRAALMVAELRPITKAKQQKKLILRSEKNEETYRNQF